MTESPLRHVDPAGPGCPLTLREAVVEAITHRTHDRLTGRGEHGRVLHGDSPTKLLAAGFLLPAQRRTAADGDGGASGDATSPIHISTVGISFQVSRGVPGAIRVRPKGSIYVRVLPSPIYA